MPNLPNVVMRGGPADGQMSHLPTLGDPMPFEDVGRGSTIYVDSDEFEEHAAPSCGLGAEGLVFLEAA